MHKSETDMTQETELNKIIDDIYQYLKSNKDGRLLIIYPGWQS